MNAVSDRRLPPPFAGAATVTVATLATVGAGRLLAGPPSAVDRSLLDAVRGAGPAWLREGAIELTALGGGAALTIVVLLAAALLLVRRHPLAAGALVAGCWGGGRAVAIVKEVVARARPDLADRLVPVTSASFPSAHAANSAIVYLTLAALAARSVGRPGGRRALFAAAMLLTAAIGASRVFLGVHWPTDVLAGWSFGALWALGWWWLTARARASLGGER